MLPLFLDLPQTPFWILYELYRGCFLILIQIQRGLGLEERWQSWIFFRDFSATRILQVS